MIRKTSIVAAVVLGAASFATAADNSRVVYAGGHDAVQLVRIEARPQTTAPYALTGSERLQRTTQTENIWVGNRFVGARTVQK